MTGAKAVCRCHRRAGGESGVGWPWRAGARCTRRCFIQAILPGKQAVVGQKCGQPAGGLQPYDAFLNRLQQHRPHPDPQANPGAVLSRGPRTPTGQHRIRALELVHGCTHRVDQKKSGASAGSTEIAGAVRSGGGFDPATQFTAHAKGCSSTQDGKRAGNLPEAVRGHIHEGRAITHEEAGCKHC